MRLKITKILALMLLPMVLFSRQCITHYNICKQHTCRKFRAIMSQSVGLQGQSYGIPTM
ncbi:MAG: hypothetical protein II886_05415 [Prevotella sp.]|nr:hypothetical protein [Prevotella sp.]